MVKQPISKTSRAMTPAELKERTMQFAIDAIRFSRTVPRDEAGRVVSRQLIRSASSVAANYRAACRAGSRRSFIAKMSIVEEEADECAFWIETLIKLGCVDERRAKRLLNEAYELLAITVASKKTARNGLNK